MTTEIKCPVCGQTATDRFCAICGFELHVLPAQVSTEMEAYERERVSKFKEKLKEIDDYVVKTKNLTEQLNATQKELEEVKGQKSKLEAALAQKDKIQETGGVKAPEKPVPAIPAMPLAYLVMMQGGNVFGIYSIFEGENTFGYAVSKERHRQILCSAKVEEVHFAVKAVPYKDQRGRKRTKFMVAPVGGRIYASAGGANIIKEESVFAINDSVYIEDVRFTLVSSQ